VRFWACPFANFEKALEKMEVSAVMTFTKDEIKSDVTNEQMDVMILSSLKDGHR
jgi:hypothetical protein